MTAYDQITMLERDAAEAAERAQRLAAKTARARSKAEAERRERRAEVWQAQLAEIETLDLAGDVAAAQAALAASIRGEEPTPPVVNVFRLLLAEKRHDQLRRHAAHLRVQLGVPGETQSPAPRPLDPLAMLGQAVDTEAERAVQAEADRMAAEVEAAWRGEDLPPLPPALDPSRYGFLQDRVANAKSRIGEARQHLDAALAADDTSPTKQEAIAGAADELAKAQEALRVAEAKLVEFTAGRIT